MDLISGLSDEKRETLKKFRSNLADVLTPDHTDVILVKFLRAKNFDLKKAEVNFREVLWNRLSFEIDTIVENFELPESYKYRGDTFLGFAKDGTPIRYVTAKVDFYGFLQSVPAYKIALFFVYLMEYDIKKMKEENMRSGRKNTEITYIFDLEGYSLRQLTHKSVIETGIDSMRLLQDHYPERWGNIFFVNAPYIYDKVFSIFKPFLHETLIHKIQFVSKDGTGELLRKYVDEDVLPAFLGGKRVDSKGDIFCKEFLNQGGKIPEKYYLRNWMHFIDESDPDVHVVTIGARSSHNVPLVMEKGTRLKLEMRTENGSLVFCVLFRELGPDPNNPDFPSNDEYLDPHDEKCNVIMIATRLKVHSHIAPNIGSAVAANTGIYILQFDNTDSWFTSKKLYYRISFLPSDIHSQHLTGEYNFII